MALKGIKTYKPSKIDIPSIVFNPFVSGALIWGISLSPPAIRNCLLGLISRIIKTASGRERLLTGLKWLFGLGVLGRINARLNSLALNHWKLGTDKSRWVWNQEVAVITGGCGGFGLLTTERLVRRGVKVALLDVAPLPDRLAGPMVFYQKCDITDPEAVMDAAEKIRKHFGRDPSILFNNAGMIQGTSILSTPPARIAKLIAINMTSHFHTCQAFVPAMVRENKGHVITMCSMASYATVAGTTDYAMSKAGKLAFHEGLTASLRNEYKAPGVLTTSVHPNWTNTPLINKQSKEVLATLAPILEADYIADSVAESIFSCRGGQSILPPTLNLTTSIRGWPNWVQELTRDKLSLMKIE